MSVEAKVTFEVNGTIKVSVTGETITEVVQRIESIQNGGDIYDTEGVRVLWQETAIDDDRPLISWVEN